ncbi:MAG: hypothetical protein ABI890_08865 [Lapillicoccus sp.]
MSTTDQLRHRLTVASFVVVALVAVTFGWFATRVHADVAQAPRLHDGGVWVSTSARSLIGRLNVATRRLDGGVVPERLVGEAVPPGTPVDVVQDGAAIVGLAGLAGLAGSPMWAGAIDPDTARFTAAAKVPLPPPSKATGLPYAVPLPLDVRGGTVALVDPATGRLWAQRAEPGGTFATLDQLAPAATPLAVVGATAAVAVGEDGSVYAASAATGTVVTLTVDEVTGALRPARPSPLGFTSKAVELTVVGTRWVAFDPETALLHSPGLAQPVEVSGSTEAAGGLAQVALQQPGAASSAIVVQTAQELRVVPIEDGVEGGVVVSLPDAARTDSAGNALPVALTAPVRAGSCVHGAWTGPQTVWYGRSCAAGPPQVAVRLGTLPTGTHVAGARLRVNHGLIVLNDLDTGIVWDLDADPLKIDDWAAVTPQLQGLAPTRHPGQHPTDRRD